MARRISNANKLQVRPGMSLLEVIVSTAIFFLSLVAIYGLLEVSQRSGVRARQRGQSLRICQARLAELVAGVIPLESSDGTDEQATDYQWQVTVEPDGDSSGSLMKATAIAFHKNEPRDSRVALTQIVLDPLFVGSLMDAVPSGGTATEEPGSTGTDDPSASASGGSSGTAGASASTGAAGGASSAGRSGSSGGSGSASRSSSTGTNGSGSSSSGGSSSRSTTPSAPSTGGLSGGSGSMSGSGSSPSSGSGGSTRGGR
jgi:Tfp pilus assembly protein PilV